MGNFNKFNCSPPPPEWWDAVLQKRLARALFVLLLSLVCCQPIEFDLGVCFLLFHKFSHFTPPPSHPLFLSPLSTWLSRQLTFWKRTWDCFRPKTLKTAFCEWDKNDAVLTCLLSSKNPCIRLFFINPHFSSPPPGSLKLACKTMSTAWQKYWKWRA